jgi:hypothetical protein
LLLFIIRIIPIPIPTLPLHVSELPISRRRSIYSDPRLSNFYSSVYHHSSIHSYNLQFNIKTLENTNFPSYCNNNNLTSFIDLGTEIRVQEKNKTWMTVVLFAPSHWNGLHTDLVCTVRSVPPASLVSVSYAMIAVAVSVRPNAISSLLPRYHQLLPNTSYRF